MDAGGLQAVKDWKRVAELKRRSRSSPSAEETPGSEDENLQFMLGAGVPMELAERALELEAGDVTRALLRATDPLLRDDVESGGRSRLRDRLIGGIQSLGTGALGLVQQAWAASVSCSAGPLPSTEQQQRYPYLFVPGQIIHLYRANGLARAASSHCRHQVLSQITLAQDMLNDHMISSYDEAFRQASIPEPRAPRWESFDARKVCPCCQADFNWKFVVRSQPQLMLARHSCFGCGRVVCGGCSGRGPLPHPALGFALPVRTCDRCFFAQDGAG